jgi:putative FmdB family regulatory protein
MPIYEYACPGCGKRFEKLVRRFGEAVACPSCASPDVEKQLSVFAVATAAPPAAFAGCGAGACSPGGGGCETGPCGGGACGLPS